MTRLVVKLGVNAFALWLTAVVLPGFEIEGSVVSIVLVAIVFGLVNTFIRPVARLLTLPLRTMTLGLFTLVVNGFMVIVTTWITDALVLDGGMARRMLIAIAAAVIISIVGGALNVLLPESFEA